MDFTKLENIIFVAVAGALALFLFIMAFYVISKGRRKTSGLDIFLRILSAVVMVASAALFVLAIFTDLTGGFRIAAAGDKAFFVIGDSMTELPLGALFVTLSTPTGHTIAVGLFIISFMTLFADCMLAKKKYGKKTEKQNKTPEQIKRDAELEKIRKLSDAAVRKSNSAVSAAEKSEPAPSEQNKQEQEHPAEEADFDWRVSAPEKKNEFVGISNAENDDSSFDSFDDFGADAQGETNGDDAQTGDDTYGGEQNADQTHEQDGQDTYEQDDAFELDDEAQEQADGGEDAFDFADGDDQSQTAENTADDYEKPWYEQDDPADERIIAEALADNPAPARGTTFADAHDSVEANEEPTEERQDEDGAEQADEGESDYSDYEDGIEPDRNIYIPGIRTVNRTSRGATQNVADAKSDVKQPKKQTSKKQTPATKQATVKPTAAKQTVAKSAPKKQTAKAASAKAAKPADKPIDPRKLPVTRRYVILDRTNAVNIFSNYLKEREKADKDKLESSINTIIIK